MSAVSTLPSSFAFVAALAALACAPAAARPPNSPTPTTLPAAAPPGDPAATPPDFSAIPPAPASCDAFVAHRAPASCATTGDGQPVLAAALAQADSVKRDASLASLLPCSAYPAGVIAALRAELGPPECGDVILGELAAPTLPVPDPAVRDALTSLGIAAQLERLVAAAPELEPPFDKERFKTFMTEVLAAWIVGQAKAIQTLSERGAKLSGYGKGVVAIHAGLADMRFVAKVRDVPLPAELSDDAELKDAYYGALDQALEPRKARGRDAALVGLRLMAEAGVHNEPRVQRARRLLSEVYAGRRIDALDGLLLPAQPPVSVTGARYELAARMPTFYVERTLPALAPESLAALTFVEPEQVALAQALLAGGLPPRLRARLDALRLNSTVALAYGHALVRSGKLFWRATDFEQAAKVLGGVKQGPGAQDAALLAAVSETMRRGARDAVEMMSRAPFPTGKVDVVALDRLAQGRGDVAARASFDAALVLGLAPPERGAKAFFTDLERRYRAAAERAVDADARREATARAAAAAATAAAVAD